MIIGVSGKARSGKGEFAKVAQAEFGATIVTFASGVKEECADWLNSAGVVWTYRNLYGENEDKEATLRVHHSEVANDFMIGFVKQYADYSTGYWYFTARSLMQWWGTEYRRKQDPDYWVKKAMCKCKDYKLYVIDDMRFPNEVKAIKDTGGRLVRIERPDRPRISNELHPSEVALDYFKGWHYTIINGTTLDHYKNQVRLCLKEYVRVD